MNKRSLAHVYCIQAFWKIFKYFEKWHEGSVISAKIIVKNCNACLTLVSIFGSSPASHIYGVTEIENEVKYVIHCLFFNHQLRNYC